MSVMGRGPPAGPAGRGSAASSEKSRVYPAASSAAPSVGSTSPSVSRAAWSATSSVAAKRSDTIVARPLAAFTRFSSLPGMNRLNMRSRSRKSRSTSARSAARPPRTTISHPIDSNRCSFMTARSQHREEPVPARRRPPAAGSS